MACVPSLRMPLRQPCAETSSKSSISLLEKLDFSSRLLVCFPLFHRNRIGKPGFWSGFQARKARFSPPKPGFWAGFQARKVRFSSPKPGRNRTKNRPPKPLCPRGAIYLGRARELAINGKPSSRTARPMGKVLSDMKLCAVKFDMDGSNDNETHMHGRIVGRYIIITHRLTRQKAVVRGLGMQGCGTF